MGFPYAWDAVNFVPGTRKHKDEFPRAWHKIARLGKLNPQQRTTGKAELLFWPGQKRVGAATGPEG